MVMCGWSVYANIAEVRLNTPIPINLTATSSAEKNIGKKVILLAKTHKANDLYRDKPERPNQKLRLTLPITPSINNMYIGKTKKLNKRATSYIRDCRSKIHQTIEDEGWLSEGNSVWMYVDVVVFMPDRKIRDSHNMIKLLMDLLEGICFHNDYFACPRIMSVEYDKGNPRLEIIIRPQREADRRKALDVI